MPLHQEVLECSTGEVVAALDDGFQGERLVTAKRPGMELVVAAHKSVAELGVLGKAEDMHAIMDADRDATLAYLDALTQSRGGRRGVAAVPTATTGLAYSMAELAELARQAGFAVHTRLVRAAQGGWERRPQASLLATRPAG